MGRGGTRRRGDGAREQRGGGAWVTGRRGDGGIGSSGSFGSSGS